MSFVSIYQQLMGKAKNTICRSAIFVPILRKASFSLNSIVQNKFNLIKKKKITVVLDVGAHAGEYGVDLRYYGYKNKIVSFEPMKDAFLLLKRKINRYRGAWECHNYALGNSEGKQKINILNNRPCSSFLETSKFFTEAYGNSTQIVREEVVEIKKLDDIYSQFCNPHDQVLLKLDVQGFEKHILDGGERSLPHISLVQLEVSIVPFYDQELPIAKMIDYMESKGFIPACIEPHPPHLASMQMLQADILFVNVKRE
jgi:FkbM family methyltransferase